jgi:capsular exopolysaccharide synthesis family protein
LNSLRESYGSFLANSQEGALNILSVVEPANLPNNSVGTNKLVIIGLAALVGFTLGAAAAYLLEFLDRTIKTTTDVERIFNLPVIGYISEISENGNNATYVAKNPNSVLAENFRLLRSNIDFFRISNPLKTILVTSPSQGNGKTTIAANLALSMAQGDEEVVLVDADLRRPAVHAALKVSKDPGLSDVIANRADIQGVVRHLEDENVNVITAGEVPQNITEVVGSKRITSILAALKENYEMVIVDAPPLIISDSYNLASKVDGVILILEPGVTSEEQARTIKEQLDRAEAKVLGIVFNKISAESAHSYSDYRYQSLYSPKYYGDYTAKEPVTSPAEVRSKKLMAFFEHGQLPPEVATEVENAISAIKTQPRNLLQRVRKVPKKS